ncbi:MAG: hypothetical protein HY515_01445 [Candidatus Aenigmarchaeota archaeon]|nr:hypothetical protein [Candidatus Aenigmarchaeota archaeon]
MKALSWLAVAVGISLSVSASADSRILERQQWIPPTTLVAQQQRRGVGQWMKEEFQEYKEGVKDRWREQRENFEEKRREREERAREREMERNRERAKEENKYRGYLRCIGEWKAIPSRECR